MGANNVVNGEGRFELRAELEFPIEPIITTLPATLSRITATNPPICTKVFYPDGFGPGVKKETHADVYEGEVERIEVESLADFANVLLGLGTNQCLSYGSPALSHVKLTTKEKWAEMGQPSTHVARTKAAFSWTTSPGILMLDYDAPKDGSAGLSRDELVAAVRSACPGLADAAMLWWPSTSSCIWNTEADEEMVGIGGQRLYMLVREGTDIERAGAALNAYLWAAGFGRFEVGAVGQALERGLFDTNVWQSNRIDFAAGAKCQRPFEQRRGKPVLIPGANEYVNTRTAIPNPTGSVVEAAEGRKRAARAAIKPEASKVLAEAIERKVKELVEHKPSLGPDEAREVVVRAFEHDTLAGDWLIVVDGKPVAVGEILDHPKQYHGKLTLDPVEPEYDGGRAVGKLFLFGATPRLYSFAHGGKSYRLERQPACVVVAKGRAREVMDETLDRMRRSPDLFDFDGGGGLVSVSAAGEVLPFNDALMRYWLGGAVRYVTETRREIDGEWVVEHKPADIPGMLPRDLLNLRASRGLRPLKAVVTAPTLRPDGTVLDQPGYDAATSFLLHLGEDEAMPVPDSPTREQAENALRELWRPFEKFPFAGPLDRAAHLAALLTAAARPAFATAPAFAYDAPTFGSGKTLLAKCVGALATGIPAAMYAAPTGLHGEEEMRKLLLTLAMAGKLVAVFDNIMGVFNSASFAGTITSGTVGGRVLGANEEVAVPVRTLFMLTGNNLTLAGDMPRRVLTCRIDPRMETPFTRRFEIDPERYCLSNRQMLVSAALLLIRYYLSVGVAEPGAGRMASFEDWDRIVRQTVLYLDKTIAPGQFGDVMEIVETAQANDPDHEAWGHALRALRARYALDWFKAADVSKAFEAGRRTGSAFGQPTDADADFHAAFLDFSSGKDVLSPRSAGSILKNRADRIVDGLRVEMVKDRQTKVHKFRVVDDGSGTSPHPATVVPWKAERLQE